MGRNHYFISMLSLQLPSYPSVKHWCLGRGYFHQSLLLEFKHCRVSLILSSFPICRKRKQYHMQQHDKKNLSGQNGWHKSSEAEIHWKNKSSVTSLSVNRIYPLSHELQEKSWSVMRQEKGVDTLCTTWRPAACCWLGSSTLWSPCLLLAPVPRTPLGHCEHPGLPGHIQHQRLCI